MLLFLDDFFSTGINDACTYIIGNYQYSISLIHRSAIIKTNDTRHPTEHHNKLPVMSVDRCHSDLLSGACLCSLAFSL